MPFSKGKQKTGGRKPGTPNKATTDLKSRISTLMDAEFDAISTDLELLDPKDRVTAYLKFLEFVLPKQRESKLDVTTRLEQLSEAQLNELIDQILSNP